MLELVREYAAERLREAGDDDELRRRHRDWFVEWSGRFRHRLDGDGDLQALRAEHNNLRAALRWSFGREHESHAALTLCLNLGHFWRVAGYWQEGRNWLDELLRRGEAISADKRATVLTLAGGIAAERGDYPRARALYEQGASLHREVGADRDLAIALKDLAYELDRLGEPELSVAARNEALALMRESGNERYVGIMLCELGAGARERGDYEGALGFYTESLEVMRRVADPLNVSVMLYNLGEIAVDVGDYERAATLLAECRAMADDLGVPRVGAHAAHMAGYAAVGAGDLERAEGLLREALALHREQGNMEGASLALAGFSLLAAARNEWERAARIAGAAEALRDSIGLHATPADLAMLERAVGPARQALGEPGFERSMAEGKAMTVPEALAYAAAPFESSGPRAARRETAAAPAREGGTAAERPTARSREGRSELATKHQRRRDEGDRPLPPAP